MEDIRCEDKILKAHSTNIPAKGLELKIIFTTFAARTSKYLLLTTKNYEYQKTEILEHVDARSNGITHDGSLW